RRHTRSLRDWSSDVCSSDLLIQLATCEEGYLALHLARLLRMPFVIYAHGNEVLGARDSAWAKPRQALRSASRVLANSRYTAGLRSEERRVGKECRSRGWAYR